MRNKKLDFIVPDMSRRQKLAWLVYEAKENIIAVKERGEGRFTYEFSCYSNAELGYMSVIATECGMHICISFREENQEVYFYFEED